MNKLYKVGEVAKMLNVHPATIRRWIKTGKMKAEIIGKSLRIRLKEVERIMQ